MIAKVQPPSGRRAVLALGGGGARGLAHFGAAQPSMKAVSKPNAWSG
ncbi:MAG: hypothetical protein R3C56_21440 [Pirellulaceae bacterium]